MIKLYVFLSVLFVSTAQAYVPTVESLFRHGSNPDVLSNGLSITMVVKKVLPGEKAGNTVNDVALVQDTKVEDFFRLYFTKNQNEALKVSQTRYNNPSYSESALEHKIYYPNFNSYTIKPDLEHSEKGIFFGVLYSLALNNGAHMVNYLKALGIPVKLNEDIINREKVEFLANYKRYLVTVNKDRNARKSEVNPMRPDDSAAKDKAESIMGESMYVDLGQVKLGRDEGQVAWIVTAGAFEAVFSYKDRDLQRIKYKTSAGEYEIICKDYWLANGTHLLPRYILVKTFTGQQFQVEITNLRHYIEKDDDLVKRLKNWDLVLKGKESPTPRPEFLL